MQRLTRREKQTKEESWKVEAKDLIVPTEDLHHLILPQVSPLPVAVDVVAPSTARTPTIHHIYIQNWTTKQGLIGKGISGVW